MCLFWLLCIVTLYHFLISTSAEEASYYAVDGTYCLRIKPFSYSCYFFFRRAKIHEYFSVLGVAELNSIDSFEL